MFQLKKVFVALFSLNFGALIVLYMSMAPSHLPFPQKEPALVVSTLQTIQPTSDPYSFDQPLLAHHLLKFFDQYEPLDPKYINHIPGVERWRNIKYMGLIQDDEYCNKHRTYFASDPKAFFEQTNACMDHYPKSYARFYGVKGVLTDLQPNLSAKIEPENKDKRINLIDPRHQHLFINNYLHAFVDFGKNFACLTQSYNHIPGDGYLNRKDYVSEAITTYAKKYLNRPQCFSYDKAFPRTWVMYLKDQCIDFFNSFKSEQYSQLKAQNGIVYIRKTGAGAHNGKGVFLMDPEEEKKVQELYANGAKCGVTRENNIIQYFVPNPLLLYGHKFDFRVYLLIASTNPMMAYYYDGYLKVSLQKYEPHSGDVYSMITNTHVSTEFIKKATNGTLVSGMNETELQYFQRWDFERFRNYMLTEKKVTDPDWLDNYLRPEFKRAMIHLVRMTQHKFLKSSQVFEVFGIDFMLDENLNLWFIEANSSPSLSPTYPESGIFIKKHIKDFYEIAIGLTRSRIKRIIKFINDLTKQKKDFGMDALGELQADIFLHEKKDEFKKITQNGFEKEFEPSPENGYSMIIDEHLEGPARYMGLLSEECL